VAVQREAGRVTDTGAAAFSDFDALYLQEHERVVRHLVYLTGERAVAEDLAQEAFGRLLGRGADAEALENPRAWLLTVASNLAYNHFRAEGRREAREERAQLRSVDEGVAGVGTEGRIRAGRSGGAIGATRPAGEAAVSMTPGSDLDAVLDVRRALEQLPARDRAVLLLRHAGFSYAEVAEAVGLAPASLGTTLARAQRRFREVYEGGSGASAGTPGNEGE
jgi:RNA polymerase sigma-70 factor (ECF subfamily)